MFMGEWKNKHDVRTSFFNLKYYPTSETVKKAVEAFEGVEILFASSTYEDYNEEAFVLLDIKGELYEVIGTHCSCYDLEDQWRPKKTTVQDVRNRMKHEGERSYHKALKDFLDDL